MKLIEFHKAIFNRIRDNVDERVGVYDYLPPNEPVPFVVLGLMKADQPEELISKSGSGYAVTQRISISTRAKEKGFALTILKQIQEALLTPLEVEGAFTLRQKFLNIEVEETSDAYYYCETDFEIWLMDEEEM